MISSSCVRPHRRNVWWGKVNRSFEQAGFDKLREKVLAHLQEETSTYRIASPEPTPNTASRSGSSRNTPGTASSPATCSCARIGTRSGRPRPRIHRHQRPDAPSRQEADGTNSPTVILMDFGG